MNVLNTFTDWYTWFQENVALILISLTLLLFSSKSLYNIPMGIMALIGLYHLIKSGKELWDNPTIRLYTLLFFCLWIPLLVSLVDAVNYERSSRTVFSYLRFLFIGYFLIPVLAKGEIFRKINIIIFCVVAFWCIDAVIQYLLKINLFAQPYLGGYITGIFYPSITIGHVTAALSPLFFETIRINHDRNKYIWILIIPLFAVILLCGRRAAWIMLMVSVAGYLFYYIKLNLSKRKIVKELCLAGLAIVVFMGLIVASNQPLQKRIQITSNILSADHEEINVTLGQRFHLWETSSNIFLGNWLNGVGPRGYRYVYQQYSSVDNYFHHSGQTHPHQIVLEVLTETGAIGFIGLMIFSILFYRFIKRHKLELALYPWILAIVTAIFPFNTHMAFYGSYWSSLFWWLLAMTFAAANIHIIENKKLNLA